MKRMGIAAKLMAATMVAVFSLGVPMGLGAEFYVRGDGSGSDSADGLTWGTAWATIQKALTSAPTAATGRANIPSSTPCRILVQASAGAQSYDVAARSVAASLDLDFEGGWENVDTTPTQTAISTVKDSDGTIDEAGLSLAGAYHGTWRRMVVNQFAFTNVTRGVQIVIGSGVDSADVYLIVSNSIVYAKNDGLYIDYPKPYPVNGGTGYGAYTRITAENIRIVAGQSGSGHGLFANGGWMGSSVTATGTDPATGGPRVSSITSAGGAGVYFNACNNETFDATFRNLAVYDCASDGLYLAALRVDAGPVTNWYRVRGTLANCTLSGNGGDGLRMKTWTASSWAAATNCIFANNVGHGINVGDAGYVAFPCNEAYSDLFNDDIYTNGAAQALAGSDVTGDPLFNTGTDKPYPYFTLASIASPCYATANDGGQMGAYQDLPLGNPRITNAGGATNVLANSAWLNGLLTYTGAAPATVWAFWGDNDGGATPGSWDHSINMGGRTQQEAVTTQVIGLIPETTYYYRFYAENVIGEAWAAPSASFRTTAGGAADFAYRMKIAFTNYNRTEPLTDFPALAVFSNSLSGFYYTQMVSSTAGDLRFYDATVSTQLNYEIETWDTNAASSVWVQVPELTNNCFVWAYWGSPNATSPPACTTNWATWSEGFGGVWHLNDEADNSVALDSTANRANGVNYNSTNAAGVVSYGQGFDGTGDYFDLGNAASIRITGSQTISLWLRPASFATRKNPFSKAYGGEFANTIETSGQVNYYYGTTGSDSGTGGSTYTQITMTDNLVLNVWSHLSIVRDLDAMQLTWVKNGTPTNQTAALFAAATAGSSTAYIGEGYVDAYLGLLDEVRISSVARSTNWVWAEWMNMASNAFFNSCENTEQLLRIRNLSATGIGLTNATMNGQVINTGGAENPDVYVCWGTNDWGTSATSDWEHVDYVGASWGRYESFGSNITALTSNTLYYYRCYASNSTGTAWAQWAESFRSVAPPSVTNRAATGITKSAATLNGYLVGGPADVVFYWGLADGTNDPASWANTSTVSSAVAGWVSTNVSVLANGTYYYRCFTTNAYGFGWADSTTNFVTPEPEVALYADASTLFESVPDTLTVTARLDFASVTDTTVYLDFSGGAVTGADYTVSATTLVVSAGSIFGTLGLPVVNDADIESPESFTVQMVSVAPAVIGYPSSITASIISDDPAVTNQGATAITDQTATLNGYMTYGYTGVVSIFWGTTDGVTNQSAWANTNNLGITSEGSFSSAVTGLWGNRVYYYRSYITNSGGQAWAPYTTNFTTLAPYVSIADAPTIVEGNSGTTDMVFTVTLSTPSITNLWVPYLTSNNAAVAGSDYVATSGVLLFSPGDTSKTIVVPVNGDTEDEAPYEDLFCHIYSPTNGTLSVTRGYGRVLDDDLTTSGWMYKMKVSFTNYNRTEPLTNFPALVVFNTNLTGFAYQLYSTNGYDLRFLDQAESNVIPHEIESWTVNSNSYVWVQVPVLTNNAYVWAYWGSPTITAAPVYTTNGDAWSSEHLAVWHLHSTNSAGQLPDSTRNGFSGVPSGCTNLAGQIAGAQDFPDNAADINITGIIYAGGADANRNYTFGYWLKTTTTSSDARLMDITSGRLIPDITTSGTQLRYYDGTWRTAYGANVNNGAWHHAAFALDGATSQGAIYLDGAAVATGIAYTPRDIGGNAHIGSENDGSGYDYVGFMDETRIETVTRSSNWIWACWMNMGSNSVFNTHDPAQCLVSLPSIRNDAATNITVTSGFMNGTLVSTGTASTAVSLYWGTIDGGTNFGGWQNTNSIGPHTAGVPYGYSTNITGLTGDYTYFYRYYATNSAGGSWAPTTVSFTTLTDPARYPYKIKITFSGYDRSEPLTNFPALVKLSESLTNFLYSQFVATNAWDLRFADATESTQLNYEIEKWDTNSTSFVWVKVPELTNNCSIWAYWGNPTATNQPAYYTAQGSVWDSNFKGVWHMARTNALDSTANRYDGSAQGTVTSVSTGLVDGANDFVQDSSYVSVPANSDFVLSGDYTLACWVRPNNIGNDWQSMMGTYAGGTAGFIFSLENDANNEPRIWANNTWNNSGATIVDGTWNHVVYTRQGTTGRFIINGSNVTTTATALSGLVGGNLELGGAGASWAGYRWDGLLDECRISAYCRSTNWVWAEFMNMASNSVFNPYEPVQCVISNKPAIWNLAATNMQPHSATLNGTLVSTGGLATAVYVYWGRDDGGTNFGSWDNTNYFGVHATSVPAGYSTNVTSLLSDRQYYYRYYATNAAGGYWAPATTMFSTLTDPSLYPCKMKITFSGYNRSETLTNFPALVTLSQDTANFFYSQFASTNGYDLRFADAAETTILNYEFEKWNTSGASYVWAQVPQFTNNCYIWAYWGHTNATFQRAYTTNGATWTTNFVGVWHMTQTNAPDSTANRNNGTSLGGHTNAAAAIGTGQSFSGASPSGIQCATSASFDGINSNVTLSAWANLRTSANYPMIWTRGANLLELRFNVATRRLELQSPNPNVVIAPAGAAIAVNEWHYMAGTFSDPLNTQLLYIDGQPIITNASATSVMNHAGYSVYLGRRSDGYYLDGMLDEIRAENVVRSSNWIWACWMNMASNATFQSYVAQTSRMTVLGNGVTIANNDFSPSVADGTEFGTLATNGVAVTNTFAITNSGLIDLIMSGSPAVSITGDSADFTVVAQPSTNVGPSVGVTFQVKFQPTTSGTRTGLVSIVNNDWYNRTTYRFKIQGYGWGGFSNPAYLDHIGIGSTMPMSVDRDADGMADYWETQMFDNTSTSAGGSTDSDGDGVSDRLEFLAGTHPTNAASYMRMVSLDLATPSSSSLTLRWLGGGSTGSSSYTNAGDRVARTYTIWAAANNATNSKTLLALTDEAGLSTGTNTWTDSNVVDLYPSRFYSVSTLYGGSGYTNIEEWAMHRQSRTNSFKYLVCVPVDYGSTDANNLNSSLGAQLARGLYSNDTESVADKIQWMNASGGWDEAYLTAAGWYTNGAPIGKVLQPGQALWVVRGASNANTRANAVFTGRSFTQALVTNYTTIKTNYGGWTAFGWPLARERWHSRSAALAGSTNQLGFVAAGAKGGLSASILKPALLGDQIWLWGNDHWTNYYWLIDGAGASYDGRWWDSHAQAFADFVMQPGVGYYYWHTTNGGATNFIWKPDYP